MNSSEIQILQFTLCLSNHKLRIDDFGKASFGTNFVSLMRNGREFALFLVFPAKLTLHCQNFVSCYTQQK